jgi:DNA-binding transcriptional MerR regulator
LDKSPEAFRTISEVADDLDLPQHVLRFWESRFAQIRPMKRAGGRRYYRPDDVALLRGIRHLLYGQGYTIRGVQRILRERGLRFVQTVWEAGAEPAPFDTADDEEVAERVAVASEDESNGVFGLLRATPDAALHGVAAPAARGERLEPTLAAPSVPPRRPAEPGAAAPVSATPVSAASVSTAAMAELRATLADLVECRRLLDVALQEPG